MTSDRDMGNKRVLNLPPPRDQEECIENYNYSSASTRFIDFLFERFEKMIKTQPEKGD